MKKRNIFWAVFLLVLIIASPLMAGESVKTLKVGFLGPLSGPGAKWGISWLRTLQLRAEQINAEGGFTLSDQKYKIEIVQGDSKYNPTESVTVINKLIFKDNLKFIMGPAGSITTRAIQPITEPNKVIIMHGAFAAAAIGPEVPYSFRLHGSIGEIVPAIYKYFSENHNIKKVSILCPNDEGGWSMMAEHSVASKNSGIDIVSEEYYDRGTTDYYPVLARTLKNKPDLIIAEGVTGDLGLILKQAKQLGFKGLSFSSVAHDASELCRVAGKENAEGHISVSPFVTPGNREKWQDAYVARWKTTMDPVSFFFVDQLNLLIAAIQKAKSLDTTKVRDAIEGMTYFDSQINGRVKFGGEKRYGNNHVLLIPVPLAQVQGCETVGLVLAPPVEPNPEPPRKK